MRVGDLDFDDNLQDKKLNESSYENVLVYDISYKTFTGAKPQRIRFDEIDGFIKIMMELDILYYLVLEDIIQFMVELNIL